MPSLWCMRKMRWNKFALYCLTLRLVLANEFVQNLKKMYNVKEQSLVIQLDPVAQSNHTKIMAITLALSAMPYILGCGNQLEDNCKIYIHVSERRNQLMRESIFIHPTPTIAIAKTPNFSDFGTLSRKKL